MKGRVLLPGAHLLMVPLLHVGVGVWMCGCGCGYGCGHGQVNGFEDWAYTIHKPPATDEGGATDNGPPGIAIVHQNIKKKIPAKL